MRERMCFSGLLTLWGADYPWIFLAPLCCVALLAPLLAAGRRRQRSMQSIWHAGQAACCRGVLTGPGELYVCGCCTNMPLLVRARRTKQ